MNFKNKYLVTFLLLILVYGWFFITSVLLKPNYPVAFTASNSLSLFVQPKEGHDFILKEINNAKKEVLVEVYLLSDKQIIKSLKDSKSKGVDVRVMLEKDPFGGGNLNNKSKKELEDAKVLTSWSNPDYALTHEKSIIIDGVKVFILNQNLTASSFTKNREYDILDKNLQDVAEARSIFINDWNRQRHIVKRTHLIESPDTSRTNIESLINTSEKSIDIEIEDIADSEIVSILSNKAKNVNVRLIIPSISQLQQNATDADSLKRNGIKVRTLSSPYIHAKMILSDSKIAYTGSVNLSTQSMDKNRELGIIISQPNIIKEISETFNVDWNKAKDF